MKNTEKNMLKVDKLTNKDIDIGSSGSGETKVTVLTEFRVKVKTNEAIVSFNSRYALIKNKNGKLVKRYFKIYN